MNIGLEGKKFRGYIRSGVSYSLRGSWWNTTGAQREAIQSFQVNGGSLSLVSRDCVNVFGGTRWNNNVQGTGTNINNTRYHTKQLPSQDDMITRGIKDAESGQHNICGMDGVRAYGHRNVNKQTYDMGVVLAYTYYGE